MTDYSPLNQDKESQRGLVDNPIEPRFLVIGQITKPHGVRGEVRVISYSDSSQRFAWLENVYVGEEAPRCIPVESSRPHKNFILLKLKGYDNRETAETLRGQMLLIPPEEAVPLEEGEYYLYQLEGLQVFTDEGQLLGHIIEVLETQANNVFVVQGPTKEILLPDTEEVVQTIDFENGRIVVHLIPGLLDE